MRVGKFWLITIGTINGPWHVASLNDNRGEAMPRGVNGEYMGHAGSWYIVNKDTGRSKRIGPVKSRGKNWCDEAREEAKRRNIALGFSQGHDSKENLVGGLTDNEKVRSYNYYQEEINSLPANDPDGYGLAIQIRHEGTGAHTKWLSLTDECKDVLRKFITASPDPDVTERRTS